jgi:S1-C subfamily serine protease
MKNVISFVLGIVVLASSGLLMAGEPIADFPTYLQDISLTIRAGTSQGSGVIFTREIKRDATSDVKVKINFIWTAGHVVDGLRSTREVIDPKTGQKKTAIQFKDASIVKELNEDGRKVGEIAFDARVIKYSDAENGDDLAILMVRKTNFVDTSARFYTGESIPTLGTPLYHVGSLLGQMGANSLTTGIISQTGRVLNLGNTSGKVFDQTTVAAFPGSSGGGVYISDGDHRGEYVGMLVRGAGETFNLIVPIRRMREWAIASNVLWAIDPSVEAPTFQDITMMPVEALDVTFQSPSVDKTPVNKD